MRRREGEGEGEEEGGGVVRPESSTRMSLI